MHSFYLQLHSAKVWSHRDGSEEHLFGEKNISKHGFDKLIKELIEKKIVSSFEAGKNFIVKELFKKVVENGIPAVRGAWATNVRIGNYDVTVRTIMADGVLRIGTAFIKALFFIKNKDIV